jgi:hypothetical protein
VSAPEADIRQSKPHVGSRARTTRTTKNNGVPGRDAWTDWRSRALAICLTIAAVLGLAAAQVFYQAGAPSFRTIWAEDGQVFYVAAAARGIAALATPYAGYLQTVPRVLAIPATWLPPSALAVYFAAAGALCSSLVAVSLYWLTDQAISSRVLRMALVFAAALLPVLAFENMANITNTIWLLAFAVFWALVRVPRTTGAVVLGTVITFLGVMSSSTTIVFVPVAAYVFWTRRDRMTRVVLAGYATALALQGITYVTEHSHGPTGAASGLPTLYVARVVGGLAVGEHWAAELWDGGGRTHLFPFAALVVVLIAVLMVLTRGRGTLLASTCVAHSVVLFVGPLLVRGTLGMELTAAWTSAGARYAALGILFLLAAVMVLITNARIASTWRHLLTALVVLQLLVVVVFAYRPSNPRSPGPEWAPRLSAAADRCRTRHPTFVNVPITPGGGWAVTLSCQHVLQND